MARSISLKEEETRWVERDLVTPQELNALSAIGKFDVQYHGGAAGNLIGLRPRGVAGILSLGDLEVRIEPKVPVSHVFRMLEFSYNLRGARFYDEAVSVATIEDLQEHLISMLCKMILARARRGLYRCYVAREESLPYFRGQVSFLQTLLNTKRGVPKLECRFEEHDADNVDNRILLHAVSRALGCTLRPNTRRSVELAYRVLKGAVSHETFSSLQCQQRTYNRLNSDYLVMHSICRLIIDCTGVANEEGPLTFVSFLLDMPRIFESFIAEWLRQNIGSGFRVRSQVSKRVDANFQMNIRPDIVVEDTRTFAPLAILDTKYKIGSTPSPEDFYQIAFYARELKAPRAFLVYPSASGGNARLKHDSKRFASLVFDLSEHFETAGALFVSAFLRQASGD